MGEFPSGQRGQIVSLKAFSGAKVNDYLCENFGSKQ